MYSLQSQSGSVIPHHTVNQPCLFFIPLQYHIIFRIFHYPYNIPLSLQYFIASMSEGIFLYLLNIPFLHNTFIICPMLLIDGVSSSHSSFTHHNTSPLHTLLHSFLHNSGLFLFHSIVGLNSAFLHCYVITTSHIYQLKFFLYTMILSISLLYSI